MHSGRHAIKVACIHACLHARLGGVQGVVVLPAGRPGDQACREFRTFSYMIDCASPPRAVARLQQPNSLHMNSSVYPPPADGLPGPSVSSPLAILAADLLFLITKSFRPYNVFTRIQNH